MLQVNAEGQEALTDHSEVTLPPARQPRQCVWLCDRCNRQGACICRQMTYCAEYLHPPIPINPQVTCEGSTR